MHVSSRISDRHRPIAFLLLLGLMLVIAAGHLYAFHGLDALYHGLPLWLWLQLVVVAGLFVIAWIATGLISPSGGS